MGQFCGNCSQHECTPLAECGTAPLRNTSAAGGRRRRLLNGSSVLNVQEGGMHMQVQALCVFAPLIVTARGHCVTCIGGTASACTRCQQTLATLLQFMSIQCFISE